MLRLRNLSLGGILVLAATLGGCVPATSEQAAAANEGAPTAGARDERKGVEGPGAQPPCKVCVAADVSRSMKGTHTAGVRAEELTPILDHLERVSGEIAVALIGENDLPLLRVAVDSRPVKPVVPPRTDDGPEWARRVNLYRAQMAKFEADEQRWQQDVAPLINAFKSNLSVLLSHERVAMNSRVLESVARCDLFLNENDQVWGRPTRRYLLAVTDGKDDYGPKHHSRKITPLRSGATLYVINGNASTNSLASLKPQPVESFSAAIRQVLAADGGEK